MYCQGCGNATEHGTDFCANCGTRVEMQQQQSPPQDPWGSSAQQFGGASPFGARPARPAHEIAEAMACGQKALIFGILAMVFFWTGLLGVIFAPIAMSNATRSRQITWEEGNENFYLALAGKIVGAVGLGLSILYVITWTIVGCSMCMALSL